MIDTTSDGGTKWYRTLFVDGGPVAVVPSLGTNDLVAFVGSFDGASLWQYVSKDGGRVWRYQTTVDS